MAHECIPQLIDAMVRVDLKVTDALLGQVGMIVFAVINLSKHLDAVEIMVNA